MLSSFLYRRLSKWITCVLNLPAEGEIYLSSKYDVASAADVFLNPFYWQIFGLLDTIPKLVVDRGAHCGLFSILVKVCRKIKFGRGAEKYLMIEVNPFFKNIIDNNIIKACVRRDWEIISGALDVPENAKNIEMAIEPKNFLSGSIIKSDGFKEDKIKVSGLILGELLSKHQSCSVLKIDIEGSEFFLIQFEPNVFRKADIVLMEVHWTKSIDGVDPNRILPSIDLSLVVRHRQSDENELFVRTSKRQSFTSS